MNLQPLVEQFNGKLMFFDDESYNGQCTQIVKKWAQLNKLPIPNSGGTNKAADYKNFTNGYQFIVNTPDNIPSSGDIVIWDSRVGQGYGHVAVFIEGDVNTFRSFDQNWPKGSPCHTQHHNYSCVSGWLHFIPIENPPQAPTNNNKYNFNDNLTPGMIGNEKVAIMQQRLKDLGFYPATTDCTGNYRSITKKAVTDFQIKYGIVANPTDYGAGYFGPRTREVINNL
jgi:hypothetical protein